MKIIGSIRISKISSIANAITCQKSNKKPILFLKHSNLKESQSSGDFIPGNDHMR